MTRTEVNTIKERLRLLLLKNGCESTQCEYPLQSNAQRHSICKADVCGFFEKSDHLCIGEKNKINKGICIEFKSNHTDFNTNYGQNFDFEYNFFCTITNMKDYALKYIRENYKGCTIGLIIYDNNSNQFTTVLPAYLNHLNTNAKNWYEIYKQTVFNPCIILHE